MRSKAKMNKFRMITFVCTLTVVLIPVSVSGTSLWDDYAPPYSVGSIDHTDDWGFAGGYSYDTEPWINRNSGEAGWQYKSWAVYIEDDGQGFRSEVTNEVFGNFRQPVAMPYITSYQFHINYQYTILYNVIGDGGEHAYDMEIWARVIKTDTNTGSDTNVFNVRLKKISASGLISGNDLITPIDETRDYDDITITYTPSTVSSQYTYSLEFYFTQETSLVNNNLSDSEAYVNSYMTLEFYYFGVSYESQSPPPPPPCTWRWCFV